MRYSNQSNYNEIFAESARPVRNKTETHLTQKFQDSESNKRESAMAEKDEKLKFSDMLNSIKVIDSNDRVRLFKDCIEQEFQEIANKVSEYNRDGKLQINIQFKRDKKSKNGIDIYADVVKTIPKGQQKNPFYLDTRNGGLYFENPNQQSFGVVKQYMPHRVVEEGEEN